MNSQPQYLKLFIDAGAGADPEAQFEMMRRLRRHLTDSDLGDVATVPLEEVAPGAKGAAVSLSALAIAVAPATLTALVTTLQSWLARHQHASITLEADGYKLTITGDLSRQQQDLVDAFLKEHRIGKQ
jgi:hypothetical protein